MMTTKTYERRLRAVGRLIDRNGLQDVNVTEIPDGVLVSGILPVYSRSGNIEVAPKTLELPDTLIAQTEDELEKGRSWFHPAGRRSA